MLFSFDALVDFLVDARDGEVTDGVGGSAHVVLVGFGLGRGDGSALERGPDVGGISGAGSS